MDSNLTASFLTGAELGGACHFHDFFSNDAQNRPTDNSSHYFPYANGPDSRLFVKGDESAGCKGTETFRVNITGGYLLGNQRHTCT